MWPTTKHGRVLLAVYACLVLVSWFQHAIERPTLPDKIPFGNDKSGKVSSYIHTDTVEFWLFPVGSTVFLLLIPLILMFPHATRKITYRFEIAELPEPFRSRMHDTLREVFLGTIVGVQTSFILMMNAVFESARTPTRGTGIGQAIVIIGPTAIAIAVYWIRLRSKLRKVQAEVNFPDPGVDRFKLPEELR